MLSLGQDASDPWSDHDDSRSPPTAPALWSRTLAGLLLAGLAGLALTGPVAAQTLSRMDSNLLDTATLAPALKGRTPAVKLVIDRAPKAVPTALRA